MLEQARSLGRTSSPAMPLVVRPPLEEDSTILTARHSPEEIIDTVFRVLCGYESVSEACLRKGIKPIEYYNWHENFVEICRRWSPRRFQPRAAGSADGPVPGDGPARASAFGGAKPPLVDDEVFTMAGAHLAEDIARRAQDRLAVAWRSDHRSSQLARR